MTGRVRSASSARRCAWHPRMRRHTTNWHWRFAAAAHVPKRSPSTRPRAAWPRTCGGNIRAVPGMSRALRPAATAILALSMLIANGRAEQQEAEPLGFSFANIARTAGLDATITFGGVEGNKYLLETTGTGVAFIDYDGDGLLDLFFVNGSTLEGFSAAQAPTNHLYRNSGKGTFTDVTTKAGLAASGWGQGTCVGDYDNDGHDDLYVTYWGRNRLYRNRGDGTFEDITRRAGLDQSRTRWGTGCAFLDYDRDGRLDLFVANYIDLDLATAPTPGSRGCRYKGIAVACGPPGLTGGRNVLYRNRGDGAFEDVSAKS